jgi:hypothetical protein
MQAAPVAVIAQASDGRARGFGNTITGLSCSGGDEAARSGGSACARFGASCASGSAAALTVSMVCARRAAVAPKANVTPKASRLGLRRSQVLYRAGGPNLLTCFAENDRWKN